MAPIPVHTTSPINTHTVSHVFGTSPSTAAGRYTPGNTDAGPITAEPSKTAAQPAQPGAPAMPEPTNTVANSYNQRFEPTPTTALPATATRVMDSPAPPQPGAVPSISSSPNTSPRSPYTIPPPPRPVDIPQGTNFNASSTSQAGASRTRAPPHPTMTISQTHTAYTPFHSVPTADSNTQFAQDLSHPPGYRQDHHASFDDKPLESCQPYEPRTSISLSSSRRGGGILDAEPVFGSANNGSPKNESSNVLNTALSWAKAAGERLSKTEEQIWKSINRNEDTWMESGKH